ncbi:MAG: hypothetical protein AAFX41_10030 [Bacteroidota bacterium]
MRLPRAIGSALLLALLVAGPAWAQEEPLDIFGYFQAQFLYENVDEERLQGASPTFLSENVIDRDEDVTSFNLQQLNLFFRKALGSKSTAFVDLEFINTFSTGDGTGSAALNEAWVSYRMKRGLVFKLGLHVPPFNRLNEIKNRTPLLPYVVRPLVYETSFEEFLALEDYLPNQAFAQVSGTLPYRDMRFSYACYLGNTGNVNTNPFRGQTGVDTTTAVLVGGRVGARVGPMELGLSASRDVTNRFESLGDTLRLAPGALRDVPRLRFGSDLQVLWGPWSLDAEILRVSFDDDQETISLRRTFYYATLGYEPHPAWLGYVSFWSSDELGRLRNEVSNASLRQGSDVDVLTAGLSFAPTDRVRLKGQYAVVWLSDDERSFGLTDNSENLVKVFDQRSHVLTLAVSVMF